MHRYWMASKGRLAKTKLSKESIYSSRVARGRAIAWWWTEANAGIGLNLLGGVGALALLGAGLVGEELGENVGEDTTLGDDDRAEELVQLLVVADGELKVTGHDTRLLVVTGGVTGELEDLGGKVLEDGGKVDGGTGTDTLGVVAALEETVDTTDRDWDVRRSSK